METITNKELLELAAKAAGITWPTKWPNPSEGDPNWNPLTNDGDALRLLVKAKITIDMDYLEASWIDTNGEVQMLTEYGEKDPYAATRRAIVRAAAEIGRSLSA